MTLRTRLGIIVAALVVAAFAATAVVAQPPSPRARIVSELRAHHLRMRVDGAFQYEFFAPKARAYWNASGEALLWQFRSRARAAAAAESIAPNGSTIGRAAVFWLGTPHWFRRGRVVALYLGSDAAMRHAFVSVLGPQIAGG